METEIITICSELKKLSHCAGCGAKVKNGICTWCGNIYERYAELSKRLEEILQNKKQPFKVLAELVNIYDLEIPVVNALVDERLELMQSFLTTKLDNNEYNDMINMLSKDNASMVVNPDYFFQIAKKYFCGEILDMDDETYMKFIKIYTKNILEKSQFKSLYDRTPKVEFASGEEIKQVLEASKTNIDFSPHGLCVATPYGERILLNRESFLESRKSGTFENIITVYHELQHLVQKSYSKVPERFNLIGLIQAKDKVLTSLLPTYYNENYELVAFENDAESNAYMAMANDLEALGLSSLDLRERANKKVNLLFNRVRFINGEESTVDKLFDQYVTDPTVLEKYPILKLQYRIANGKITRIPPEEIAGMTNGDLTPELKVIYEYISNTPVGEITR